MKKAAVATENPVANFESSLVELETLVQQLEGGALSLEASLAAYERGVQLAAQCQSALDAAELKVQTLQAPPSA